MKIIKLAVVTAAVIASALLAVEADAHGRYRHRSGVGIYFGAPGPFYYYPRYYHYPPSYYYHYPPAVAAPAPYYPPVYIEQSAPAPAAAPSSSSGSYWYYCRDTQTYYPYVQQCATPWQQVVPNSAPRS